MFHNLEMKLNGEKIESWLKFFNEHIISGSSQILLTSVHKIKLPLLLPNLPQSITWRTDLFFMTTSSSDVHETNSYLRWEDECGTLAMLLEECVSLSN